jgi:hypothetical protein
LSAYFYILLLHYFVPAARAISIALSSFAVCIGATSCACEPVSRNPYDTIYGKARYVACVFRCKQDVLSQFFVSAAKELAAGVGTRQQTFVSL